jgi:hypothetical protein
MEKLKLIFTTIVRTIKTFWNWIKSVYDELKKIVLAVVGIFKDPFANKLSFGRLLVVILVVFGMYLALKNSFAIDCGLIVIGIACLTYIIKSFLERKFK